MYVHVLYIQSELLQWFYETTLEALQDARNDRLWFKTNTKVERERDYQCCMCTELLHVHYHILHHGYYTCTQKELLFLSLCFAEYIDVHVHISCI